MRELLPQLIDRVRQGPVALARVVGVTGAGPRAAGAAMLVTEDGEVVGSVSGGCVEAAVVESAMGVLGGGDAVLERFGVAEPEGVAIGLTCGGEMEVFIEPVAGERLGDLLALEHEIRQGRSVALVTTLDDAPSWWLIGSGAPGPGVSRDAVHMARAGRTGTVGIDECAPTAFPPRAFVQSFGPRARMILAGANDFVRALSRLGGQLGYRVTVVDARKTFATAARFPAADEVVVDWPHRYLRREYVAGRVDGRTVVCVLTHDAKFDVPLLVEALGIEDIGFVGALGSRRTHADRLARLAEAGVGPEQLRRLRSPVGLDLNASTPEETAVSIAAQIIAEPGGASGRPLAATDGPIHH
ncbi:XdhC family protein [Nocardia crassostreae]|uniref:XdhC family protein n=1 Tax=Nocardia crassostreae TaxID=53428 RepID=UPI00082B5390|nr:XdhC/CoxI family protein [Nocardia crassostreae]